MDLNSPADGANDQSATPERADDRAQDLPQPSNDRRGPRQPEEYRRAAQGNRYNTANVGITFNSATGAAPTITGIGNQGYFRDAGLRRGDRIVSAGGRQFNDQGNFYGWLGTVRPGASSNRGAAGRPANNRVLDTDRRVRTAVHTGWTQQCSHFLRH